MNFLVDSLDKIDPPLSTQCRVVALPTRQYSATRRFAVVLPLLELHVKGMNPRIERNGKTFLITF